MPKDFTGTNGPTAQKAVIFTRVSSKDQEDGYSIDAQLHRLKEYCSRRNLDTIKVHAVTESSTRGERKLFQEMIRFIKRQRQPIALVIDKIDRLQRSFKEFAALDALIQDGRLELHFYADNQIIHKHSSATERFIWSVGVAIAQNYTDQLSENVKRSVQQKIRQGEWIAVAPVGYFNIRDERGKAWIVADDDRAPLIKRLFQEYATGLYTLSQMVEKCRSWGLTSKFGKQEHLSKSHIQRMLRNPFYHGLMRVHGELHPHAYETLIDKTLFDQCQKVLDGWHKKPFHYGKLDFVFRGLISCATSGRTVSSDRKRKTYASGKKAEWIYLVCGHPDKEGKKMFVREEIIMKQVEDIFNRFHLPKTIQDDIIELIRQADHDAYGDILEEKARLERREKALTQKKDRLLDLHLEGSVTKDDYKAKQAKITNEIATVQNELKGYKSGQRDATDILVDFIQIASDAGQCFRGSNTDRKRRLMKLVFSNLQMKGDNLLYSLNSPFDYVFNLGGNDEWRAQVDTLRTNDFDPNDVERLVKSLHAIVSAADDV